LEGVLAKRRSSRYYPGRRTADWLKITEVLTIEVLIGGWRPGEGRREGSIGSLMLGVPTDAGVRYVGQVGTGFTDEALAALHERLKPFVRKKSPFVNEVPRERAKGATWLRPELVGEVEFRNWTPDGRLRAASWRGLRSDKDAADLEPEAVPDAAPEPVAEEPEAEPPPTNVLVEVEGKRIRLSNLDKVLYPDAGFTKAQVIDYYSRVAPFLLPHLKDRPVTLRRFPDGVTGQPFYEKNAARGAPEWVRTVRLDTPGSAKGNETLDFVLLNDLPSLVWAAHMAALELHVPQWKVGRSGERLTPDLLVFDLDPGAPATIVECSQVALLLREVLAAHGLKAVAKTSGSKGMQLYAAITTTAVERTSEYAKAVAEHLAREHPKLVVARMAKDLRPGRPAPTASTPVTWDEVATCRHPNDMTFTAKDVLARLDDHADLLKPLLVKKRPALPEL
jgi:bifunctional non-homologous end joining protein LigD